MEKSLKIVVRLSYNASLVLEPTRENMLLAMQLAELPIYDDTWEENNTVYIPKQDALTVRIERVATRAYKIEAPEAE